MAPPLRCWCGVECEVCVLVCCVCARVEWLAVWFCQLPAQSGPLLSAMHRAMRHLAFCLFTGRCLRLVCQLRLVSIVFCLFWLRCDRVLPLICGGGCAVWCARWMGTAATPSHDDVVSCPPRAHPRTYICLELPSPLPGLAVGAVCLCLPSAGSVSLLLSVLSSAISLCPVSLFL